MEIGHTRGMNSRSCIVTLLFSLAACSDRTLAENTDGGGDGASSSGNADATSDAGVTGSPTTPRPDATTYADDSGSSQATTDSTTGLDTSGETAIDDLCEGSRDQQAELEAVEAELQFIVDRALTYFAQSQPEPPLHRCPHPDASPSGGTSGITPSPANNCACGPLGGCIPDADPVAPDLGVYDLRLWQNNPIWAALEFEKPVGVPHRFHYEFDAENTDDGYGTCSFRAIAYVDYGSESEFMTYTISGVLDERGAVVEPIVVGTWPD